VLGDDELATAIENDYRVASLGGRRMAMLVYVDKLTRTPGAVTREDVQGLREVGFTDRDILEVVEVAAYYAYANRIADGLGIELEEAED